MILQYLADMTVILGCGYLGVLYGAKTDRRIRELENLEQMLTQLMFNISFLSLPLAEAIRRTAQSQQGSIRYLLEQVTGLLDTYPHITMREAWAESIRACRGGLSLNPEDLYALESFAENIGMGDCENAKSNIQLTLARLKLNCEQAREKKQKDGKLCKSLGFLSGILIVLLLA